MKKERERENVSNKNIDYFDLDIHSQITSLWSGLTYIVSEIICQSKLSNIDDKTEKKKKGSLRNNENERGKEKVMKKKQTRENEEICW